MTIHIKSKMTLLSYTAIFLAVSLIGSAVAQQPANKDELDKLVLALPELAEDGKDDPQTRSGSAAMKCFVDTPAFDLYTFGGCFSSGTAPITTAVFKIDGEPSNFTIIWSDSRCGTSSTSDLCLLPIRQYQSLTLNATVLNNDTGTFSTTSATAWYEGFY